VGEGSAPEHYLHQTAPGERAHPGAVWQHTHRSWRGCDFDFTGIIIGGNMDFRGAAFTGGHVDFSGATFTGGTVNFRNAAFTGGTADFGTASGSAPSCLVPSNASVPLPQNLAFLAHGVKVVPASLLPRVRSRSYLALGTCTGVPVWSGSCGRACWNGRGRL
ncbi:pentapeptide repeat-containing protein, partial [Streptomyces sp. NPDC054863]